MVPTVNILVFNAGSSSLGCRLYECSAGTDPRPIFAAKAHRVGVMGSEPSFLQCDSDGVSERLVLSLPDHRTAARRILEYLRARGSTIDQVGHRFVHGGEAFEGSVLIDGRVREKLQECVPLAPIHNPVSLSVIDECGRMLDGYQQYVVFDTGFHATMPEWAYTYPLPSDIRRRFHYRRYGFHGISYSYVVPAAAESLGLPLEEVKMIACHLGTGGSSVCAIDGGRSVDTSMGYSPLTGLLMSTRCGDVDPLLALHLLVSYDMRPDDVLSLLTDRSGLLGVAGFSSDLRDILDEVSAEREERASLAFEMYVHRLKKYIGGYVAVLGGIDALVFTDDIGLTNWQVREGVCETAGWFGLRLDPEANRRAVDRSTAEIGAEDSRVRVLAMPTEEELVIAREGVRLLAAGAAHGGRP